MTNWLEKWEKESHKDYKTNTFNVLDEYINFKPKRILDIGCGLAYESELFQKKYDSELYLLDGDFESTSERQRDIGFSTVDSFKFYNPINTLKESYNQRNMKYNFIDANNLQINDNIKFDLVYSILSCGFHYPAETYYDLIKKHTTPQSRILLDVRKVALQKMEKFAIVNDVKTYHKYKTVEIKLL